MEKLLRFGFIYSLLCFRATTFADPPIDNSYAIHFPEDLTRLCPYTSFCEQNASVLFPGNEEEMPCCQGCSCEPSCGLNNNCCFKHLDVYNIEQLNRMVCKSTIETYEPIARAQHFRMINSCIQSQDSISVQQQVGTHFYPVYSAKTGFIYFNSEIASCNNANKTIPFQKAIICSFQNDFMHDADRIILGLEPQTLCQVHFLPPDGVDLESEKCKPNVVHKCNVTGMVKEWQPFWTYCESFEANFVLHVGFQEYIYANIYCFMCNEKYERYGFGKITNKCSRWLDKITGSEYQLTVVLKHGFPFSDEDIIRRNRTRPTIRVCPPNQILVHSLTKSCRLIRCPVWKTLVQGKCEFFSNRWIGGRFAITLRVEAASRKIKISRAFFDEKLEININDKFAKWLKRKTMKRWEITSYYRLSEDKISVEYLIIQARCHFISVSPDYIEQTIKRTLEDFWYIFYENKWIPLKVYINEGKRYVFRIIYPNSSPVDGNPDFVYELDEEREDFSKPSYSKDNLLHMVPGGLWKPIIEEVLITNLFFCNQIDLLQDEYEDNENSIFFKVENKTIYDFRRVDVYDNLTSALAGSVPKTIRICLSEFHTRNVADSHRMFYIFYVLYLAVYA